MANVTIYITKPEIIAEAKRLNINVSRAAQTGIEAAIQAQYEIEDLKWGRTGIR